MDAPGQARASGSREGGWKRWVMMSMSPAHEFPASSALCRGSMALQGTRQIGRPELGSRPDAHVGAYRAAPWMPGTSPGKLCRGRGRVGRSPGIPKLTASSALCRGPNGAAGDGTDWASELSARSDAHVEADRAVPWMPGTRPGKRGRRRGLGTCATSRGARTDAPAPCLEPKDLSPRPSPSATLRGGRW